MDDQVLEKFERILRRLDGLKRITLDPGKKEDDPDILIFHTNSISITDVEKVTKKGDRTEISTIHLGKPIPVGAFDIIVAQGSTEPLIRNRVVRRRYGRLKGSNEILMWDHPHVLNMKIRSPNFLQVAEQLIRAEQWEELVSSAMLFLGTAVLDGEVSSRMLKEWTNNPTPEEAGLAP